MKEQIRDAVEIVYRDGLQLRRVRGIEIIRTDPVFIRLIRADGTIKEFNRNIIERIEEVGP